MNKKILSNNEEAKQDTKFFNETVCLHDALDDFWDWYKDRITYTSLGGTDKYISDWKEANPLKKFLLYKLYGGKYDCDIAPRSIAFYKRFFNKIGEIHEEDNQIRDSKILESINCGGVFFRGDTMTSAWITIFKYIKFCVISTEGVTLLDKKGCVPKEKRNMDMNNKQIWCDYILRNFNEFEKVCQEKDINCYQHMLDFLQVNRTVANFIPVPYKFNNARSKGGKKDYWDITLKSIYLWYNEKDEEKKTEVLTELLGKNQETQICCRVWLESYIDDEKNGWDNFLDGNYLKSFTKNKNESNIPIVFSDKIREKTATIEDFDKFFEICTCCIKKRAKSICNSIVESF